MSFTTQLKEAVDAILTGTPTKYVFTAIHNNDELKTPLEGGGYLIIKVTDHHVDIEEENCDYTVSGIVQYEENNIVTDLADFDLEFTVEYNSDEYFLTNISSMDLHFLANANTLNILLKIA